MRIKEDDAGAKERCILADYRYRRYASRYWQLLLPRMPTRKRRYMVLGYYAYSFGVDIRDSVRKRRNKVKAAADRQRG